MVLNTVSVCTAVAPTVVGTTVIHYIYRSSRRRKPTAHITYDLGLNLVRRFIEHSAGNTVEEVQAFTAQWVPVPRWVKVEELRIEQSFSAAAAKHITAQLGPIGISEVGGEKWWQWRKDESLLRAEWIEMRQDYLARKKTSSKGTRILLYIHGGAYYFGSVDEHRYQIQRHARKLKARCLAPRYRLAPQFPFPCGLHDCLTAYLYLLAEYDPKNIIVAGDSAGGGMLASMLVTLRDQGLPLPAGAMLLSPWVDLTHSFPSICGDGKLDYIPTHGFIHQPSTAWPPPILQMDETDITADGHGKPAEPAPDSVVNGTETDKPSVEEQAKAHKRPDWIPAHIPAHHILPQVELEGKSIYIRDQIQLYAPNYQLLNPLVSPVLNPSLGGLCPLLIQVGGGELLRDEQIYFAHKAANPDAYPPNPEVKQRYDPDDEILNKYPPTMVQLQVWDDVCHVPHTLSWTKPAKHMYRSVAQFGAWALARAQQTAIDIDEGYSTSGSENGSEYESAGEGHTEQPAADSTAADVADIPVIHVVRTGTQSVVQDSAAFDAIIATSKVGESIPPFEDHMIRQRVDRNGNIFPLGAVSILEALKLKPEEIGIVKEAPVHRWMERQEKWNKKYSRQKIAANKQREEFEAMGMVPGMEGETPPPTALVRRWVGEKQKKGWKLAGGDERKKGTMGMGLKWWGEWGSKQDKETQSKKAEPTEKQARKARRRNKSTVIPLRNRSKSVVDRGQADRGHRPSISVASSGPDFFTPQQSPLRPTFNLGPSTGEIPASEVQDPSLSPNSRPFTRELLAVPTFATGHAEKRSSSILTLKSEQEHPGTGSKSVDLDANGESDVSSLDEEKPDVPPKDNPRRRLIESFVTAKEIA